LSFPLQADVEISFEVNELEKAQELDLSWKMDPQHLCNENGTKMNGVGLGPFGLLVLASKDMQEYTRIFFKVFRANKKHVVLMCSDQSRYVCPSSFIIHQIFTKPKCQF
jgi:beta-fructofuranosidase